MRRRIVWTNVAVTVITLAIFVTLVVWASAARIVVTQRGFARIDADRVARGIDNRIASGLPIDHNSLVGFVRSDESVDVRLVSPPRGDSAEFTLGTPSRGQRVVATSNIPGTVSVTVHTAGDSFWSAAMRVGAVLVVIALLVVVLAWLIARRLAAGLVEPVRDLAAAAARLGSGDPRPTRRRYGIEELDAVAEVLDGSAQRIGEQLEAERRLAADVSHQLRTPLTALSMRLEEVIATDDPSVGRNEATIALQQVERLAGVVDDLAAATRHVRGDGNRQSDVDVDTVIAQQLDEWRGAFTAESRALRVNGEPGLVVHVSHGALSQIVATLLENALVHGAGAVTVRTRTTGPSVVIEVSDEGPGVPTGLARRIFDRDVSGASRSGLGLAVARALTEVEGGRLELIQAQPATFAVFLTSADQFEYQSADSDSDSDADSGSDAGGEAPHAPTAQGAGASEPESAASVGAPSGNT